MFYVGERKDVFSEQGVLVLPLDTIVTLESFVDANAHLGYRINDRWSVFAKANNIRR